MELELGGLLISMMEDRMITLLTSRRLDNNKYRVMLCDEELNQIIRADISGIDKSLKPSTKVYKDGEEYIFTNEPSESSFQICEQPYGVFSFGSLARGITRNGCCKYLGGLSELIDEYAKSNSLSVDFSYKRG